jgi:hypothetical protein
VKSRGDNCAELFSIQEAESVTTSAKPVGVGGYVSGVDSNGRTIFVADTHRGDGQRFIVRADEKLTAFLELSCLRAVSRDMSQPQTVSGCRKNYCL